MPCKAINKRGFSPQTYVENIRVLPPLLNKINARTRKGNIVSIILLCLLLIRANQLIYNVCGRHVLYVHVLVTFQGHTYVEYVYTVQMHKKLMKDIWIYKKDYCLSTQKKLAYKNAFSYCFRKYWPSYSFDKLLRERFLHWSWVLKKKWNKKDGKYYFFDWLDLFSRGKALKHSISHYSTQKMKKM